MVMTQTMTPSATLNVHDIATPEVSSAGHWGLAVFAAAYILVLIEDRTRLRKSAPLLVASGAIWALAIFNAKDADEVRAELMRSLGEYGALFLFVLTAVTYVRAIDQKGVFQRICTWLLERRLSARTGFWVTGAAAFALSPIADNLTTAVLTGALVVGIGGSDRRFIAAGCTNVVIAANSGGAFSPFGDITTLMIWQAGKVPTLSFMLLIVPALVTWLVPASVIALTLRPGKAGVSPTRVPLQEDWWVLVLLFVATVATAVTFHAWLHLPPFLGMTTGLGYYMIYCYFDCRRRGEHAHPGHKAFENVASVEWDTLLFFFGVIMCVGGLGAMGHLDRLAAGLYGSLGVDTANVLLGVLSALLDNVPVTYAVLTMDPSMSTFDWLVLTLAVGAGGSLLAIGSAAGVALLGLTDGKYTFTQHLKWAPVIAVGYAAGLGTLYGLQRLLS